MDTIAKSYKAAMSNGRGRQFEMMIEGACRYYRDTGRANIVKMPEPFRVITKDRANGKATVQFTAKAQPDFVGCLNNGRAIVFEAKYTDTGRIQRRVVTDAQANALQKYWEMGAVAAVCVGFGDAWDMKFFMLPWVVFCRMKYRYGRQYITPDDIGEYRVKFDGVVYLLDFHDTHIAECRNSRKPLTKED